MLSSIWSTQSRDDPGLFLGVFDRYVDLSASSLEPVVVI
jgi:hypothetical protein